MCSDGESNQQPFGSQAGAQSTEPHQPGRIYHFKSDFPSSLKWSWGLCPNHWMHRECVYPLHSQPSSDEGLREVGDRLPLLEEDAEPSSSFSLAHRLLLILPSFWTFQCLKAVLFKAFSSIKVLWSLGFFSLVYHQGPELVVSSALLSPREMSGIPQIAELWLRPLRTFSSAAPSSLHHFP